MVDAAIKQLGDWEEATLASMAEYHNGAAFKSKDWSEDGLPIIRIEQINNANSETDKYSGTLLPQNFIDDGDLIFSWSATLKVVLWNGGPGALNQHLYKVISKTKINQSLLLHILDFNMDKLANQSQGSTMKHITRKELSRFTVSFPRNKKKQQKIASILQTIDKAIEKTEALIEKYQQIKAGLMHDLFTRGITADGKLRPPREEAPKRYQKTAIGWIPTEWAVLPLEKKLKRAPKNGYSPREIDEWQDLYVLGLSCLTKQGFKPMHLKNAPRSAILSGAKLKNGDFLISRANTPALVGLCGIYEDTGENTIYPDLMMRLTLKGDLTAEYLELYLLFPETRIRLTALAVGTSVSMVKLNSTSIKKFKITIPKPKEQMAIVNKMKPIIDRLNTLSAQLVKLRKQKTGLMHDLLTGKVPVTIDKAKDRK